MIPRPRRQGCGGLQLLKDKYDVPALYGPQCSTMACLEKTSA